MSAQDLINWGELSRLLSGSRMNIRKNRIPKKYKEQVTNLVNCIESWQTEIKTAAIADEAGGQNERLGIPIFVLTAKDAAALRTLKNYKQHCISLNATSKHIDEINQLIYDFLSWELENKR